LFREKIDFEKSKKSKIEKSEKSKKSICHFIKIRKRKFYKNVVFAHKLCHYGKKIYFLDFWLACLIEFWSYLVAKTTSSRKKQDAKTTSKQYFK
jgi:hypothetical protein